MKQAVIGSRGIKDFDFSGLELTDVVSGGAMGIDSQVANYCKSKNIPIKEIKPDYNKYPSKVAPLVRNRQIVDEADIVYAIWDGVSRGTKYTIDYAMNTGKPTKIIFVR